MKDPFKVKASLLWGEGGPLYEVSLKPVDLKVCAFRHKVAGTKVINIFQWVDSTEIREKWELTVKEEGKDDPMGAEEVKKLEGLGNNSMSVYTPSP